MLDGLGDPSEAVLAYLDPESLKAAAKVSHGWLRVLLVYRSQIEKRLAATIDDLEKLCSAHRKEQSKQTPLNFKYYCMDTAGHGCNVFFARPWIEFVKEKIENATSDESRLRLTIGLLVDLERVKEGGLERHETALHVAARLGKLGMARALAERCSRYQMSARDHDLRTPMMTAAAFGNHRIVQLLIDVSVSCLWCMMCERGYGCGVDALDLGMRSSLHWAAKNGHLRCAERLLDASPPLMVCKVNSSKAKCSTSVYSNKPEDGGGRLRVVAKPIGRCDCEEDGQTPLHFAAAAGKVSVVKLLLRWQDVSGKQPGYGRLTEWRDQLGRTPIELAKGNGHQEVVKLLERYMPDCEAA